MSNPHPSVHALIIGGNIAGLAAAIAMSRASHQVSVYEGRPEIAPAVTGGCRLAPNITKILYQWGYEERLKEITQASYAVDCRHMETGEFLGRHVWEEELIRDAQGDFLFARYGDVLRLMHDIAEESGAKLYYGREVVDINLGEITITLDDGEVVSGDVIVGADGQHGISRTLFQLETEDEPSTPWMNVYFTTVPKEKVLSDEETATLYDDLDEIEKGVNTVWFGDGMATQGFPLVNDEYALVIFGPPDGEETHWPEQAKRERLIRAVGQSESRLRKLVEWGRDPHIVTFHKGPSLRDWWHPDGNLVLVGDAAQPFLPGSAQEPAYSFECGVTLGRLFSYLRRYEQINDLLEAYEELRRPRDISGHLKAITDHQFMTLPPLYSEPRNQAMRDKRDACRNLFEVYIPADIDEAGDGWQEWHSIVDQFAYNAEYTADDWWRRHGILAESCRGAPIEGPPLQIIVCQDINEH